MDKTTRRLLEIAGHLEAIIETMKGNEMAIIDGVVLQFYADEISELVDEMKVLLGDRLSE